MDEAKTCLKELLALDVNNQEKHQKLYDDAAQVISSSRFTSLSKLNGLPLEPTPVVTSTHNVSQDPEAFAEALQRGLANITIQNPTPREDSSSKVKYRYKNEDVPMFTGDVKDYPWWKEEMVTCVLKDQPGSWCLRVLQKYTPKEDDLTIFETHKEALAYLDKKYY